MLEGLMVGKLPEIREHLLEEDERKRLDAEHALYEKECRLSRNDLARKTKAFLQYEACLQEILEPYRQLLLRPFIADLSEEEQDKAIKLYKILYPDTGKRGTT